MSRDALHTLSVSDTTGGNTPIVHINARWSCAFELPWQRRQGMAEPGPCHLRLGTAFLAEMALRDIETGVDACSRVFIIRMQTSEALRGISVLAGDTPTPH